MAVKGVEFTLENLCLRYTCVYLTTHAFAQMHTCDVAYSVKYVTSCGPGVKVGNRCPRYEKDANLSLN